MDIELNDDFSNEFEEFKDEMPVTDSARRVMNLYYLVDTSGSMAGDKISSINQVMPEVVELVENISDSNKDTAEIKVNCLCFSTGAHWMYSTPLSADQFQWLPCNAGGLTDLGKACEELEKHLHQNADLGNTSGHFAPGIILLTDGAPTDNFKEGYEKLSKNNWFKHAIKVAIAIGTGTDNHVLQTFVGENAKFEAIYKVEDAQRLKEIIKLVSCSVSKIGSANASTDNKNKEELIQEEIEQGLTDLPEQPVKKTDGDGNVIVEIPPIDAGDIFD